MQSEVFASSSLSQMGFFTDDDDDDDEAAAATAATYVKATCICLNLLYICIVYLCINIVEDGGTNVNTWNLEMRKQVCMGVY